MAHRPSLNPQDEHLLLPANARTAWHAFSHAHSLSNPTVHTAHGIFCHDREHDCDRKSERAKRFR